MEIKEENIISAYKTADDNGKELLQALFPNTQLEANKTSEKLPITERIKTFDDACEVLGENNDLVKAYKETMPTYTYTDAKDILAYLKLRIICAALNEGWKPKFTEDEYRYYPWFYFYSEREVEEMDEEEKQNINLISTGALLGGYANYVASDGFFGVYTSCVPSDACACIGSRLCLKSDTLALYCGKQFINIWADFNILRK